MIYLIISTICFSLSFGLIKTQLAVLPSEFVVVLRLILAALFFIPFFKKVNYKKQLFALGIGAIQFGIMYFCFIKAFHYLQGNEAAILTTSTPVFVAIWAIMCGERFKPVYLGCILLSVIGAMVILWQNISFSMMFKGVLLMESSNCSFALGQVLWKKYLSDEKSETLMASAYLGATLFVLPFFIFNVNLTTLNVSLSQYLSILYLALIPTGIGFYLWNKGASKVQYGTLAIFNNLKIPLGVLFSILCFKESVSILNFVIGSLIIILAMFIFYNSAKKNLN